jgi:hypothetical protein
MILKQHTDSLREEGIPKFLDISNFEGELARVVGGVLQLTAESCAA